MSEVSQIEEGRSLVEKLPERKSPTLEKKELEFLGIKEKEYIPYIAALTYGVAETLKSTDTIPSMAGVGMVDATRSSIAGIRQLFEYNIGDGTIVGAGFLGAELVLQSVDKIAKKNGKKGIDPTTRFLTSVTFGTALATYLETTTFLNNTVDIPGDLFGVALGSATILASKVVADRLTTKKLTDIFAETNDFIKKIGPKFELFYNNLLSRLQKTNKENINTISDQISQEFTNTVNDTSQEKLSFN